MCFRPGSTFNPVRLNWLPTNYCKRPLRPSPVGAHGRLRECFLVLYPVLLIPEGRATFGAGAEPGARRVARSEGAAALVAYLLDRFFAWAGHVIRSQGAVVASLWRALCVEARQIRMGMSTSIFVGPSTPTGRKANCASRSANSTETRTSPAAFRMSIR